MRLFSLMILLFWLSACAPAINTDVTPVQHRQWVNELLSINDIPGALNEMRQALAGNPNIDDALLYADLLESQDKFKQARKAYKKALKYPADSQQKRSLYYRLALLEAADFNNLNKAEKLSLRLPPVDSRLFDLKSIIYFKKGEYKKALIESHKALAKATNNEEKGWTYFHMAQIYYELRIERETFGSLFNSINNGRSHSLVKRVTQYWEARRHIPFPKN
ncbi:MAG: hypothetical protein L3J63_04625 [Geopsychrobacter sp.]|nr:hypothetical protein [Geopsychrobacter sp.]